MCCFRRFNRHATQPTRPCLMLHFKYLYDLWGCQFWELQFFESSFSNLPTCYTCRSTMPASFSGCPADNLESHGTYLAKSFSCFPCFTAASFHYCQLLIMPIRCVQKQQLCHMRMCPVRGLWNFISDCTWFKALD